VAAGKDLDLLPFSLMSAVNKSLNPIKKLTVIIPNAEKVRCEKILESTKFQHNVEILLEDNVIEESTRIKLKSKFKTRYGWVLQQLLAVQFVLTSESAGVLLLDADTILTRDVVWLESDDVQKILVSFDYHKPYYEVLSKIIECDLSPKNIFIAHHMLLQPKYLKEIFCLYNLKGIENLAILLIQNADENDISSLCVDFELYGQGMMKLHRDKLKLRKFSNIPVERRRLKPLDDLYKEYSSYSSISMHSYLAVE
jgi:hypothetical protein